MIDKNDIYSMFCLMQTLRNSEVDFTVVKDGTKSQIFLNTSRLKVASKYHTAAKSLRHPLKCKRGKIMKTIIVCDAIHPVGFELLKKKSKI